MREEASESCGQLKCRLSLFFSVLALLGGLSYFTQDLLNCTLPGIVKHCKTRKVVPSKVVESLTKPESTPRLILDLINSVSVNG